MTVCCESGQKMTTICSNTGHPCTYSDDTSICSAYDLSFLLSCPKGQYSYSGSCYTCSAGQYDPSDGNTNCSSCSLGTYSVEGATECITCSSGTYSSSHSIPCSHFTHGPYSPPLEIHRVQCLKRDRITQSMDRIQVIHVFLVLLNQ